MSKVVRHERNHRPVRVIHRQIPNRRPVQVIKAKRKVWVPAYWSQQGRRRVWIPGRYEWR